MIHLDATQMVSPAPILKARRILEGMEVGETLELRATDPSSVRDIPAFCLTAGHELIMAREEDNVIIFEIRKGLRPQASGPASAEPAA